MTARVLPALVTIVCSTLLLSASQNASPTPSPSEERIYLTGGEVRALDIAYNTFLTSKETAGSRVPLSDLLVSIRHLSDGYHVDFECYPNQVTSWTYQYIIDPTSFSIHLTSKGTEVFHK
jgi:hypothetical protein